jgi:hypothetical protein
MSQYEAYINGAVFQMDGGIRIVLKYGVEALTDVDD